MPATFGSFAVMSYHPLRPIWQIADFEEVAVLAIGLSDGAFTHVGLENRNLD